MGLEKTRARAHTTRTTSTASKQAPPAPPTQASESDTFDLRSTIGGWWQKALRGDAALSAAYKAEGRSYDAQRAFRRRWAAEQFVAAKRTRMKQETLTQTDEMRAASLDKKVVVYK